MVVRLTIRQKPRVTVRLRDGSAGSRLCAVLPTASIVVQAGLPGAAGPPGAVIQFTHVQSVSAATWTINHNIGRWPVVQVFTATGIAMLAAIEQFSTNVTHIHFDEPVTGRAVCI